MQKNQAIKSQKEVEFNGKTLTRAQLAEALCREVLGVSTADASDLVDAAFEEISKSLENDEAVKISSFGTFSIRQKGKRVGRNPKTKVEVPILPRRVLSFKASALLKNKINV